MMEKGIRFRCRILGNVVSSCVVSLCSSLPYFTESIRVQNYQFSFEDKILIDSRIYFR